MTNQINGTPDSQQDPTHGTPYPHSSAGHPAGQSGSHPEYPIGSGPATEQSTSSPWAASQHIGSGPAEHWPAPPGAWGQTPPPGPAQPVSYPGYTPPKKRRKAILGGVASALAVVLAITAVQLARHAVTDYFEATDKQSAIQRGVETIRGEADLPAQVDSVTTWQKVTAEKDAVHFYYTVKPTFDSAAITPEDLRQTIAPTACSMDAAKSILDADITLRFSYTFEDTGAKQSVTFTKKDCVAGGL